MLDGVVYKLCCLDENIKEFYIGSSCEFNKRKKYHKSDCYNPNGDKYNLKVYKFIRHNGGWDNWDFEILLETKVDNKDQLRLLYEREFQLELKPSLNVVVEGRTRKQYRKDHREEIKQYREDHKEQSKQYYQDHKEELKEKYTCLCGAILSKGAKLKHEKRKRHLEYLESVK